MATGFRTAERIEAPPEEVWAYLTDFHNAKDWMTGIEGLAQTSPGPPALGTTLSFRARGKLRETCVTTLDPGKVIALTSAQGGVTATYTYAVIPSGSGTDLRLQAVCEASGLWKLLHPLIVLAMKASDSGQLARLKAAMARRA